MPTRKRNATQRTRTTVQRRSIPVHVVVVVAVYMMSVAVALTDNVVSVCACVRVHARPRVCEYGCESQLLEIHPGVPNMRAGAGTVEAQDE